MRQLRTESLVWCSCTEALLTCLCALVALAADFHSPQLECDYAALLATQCINSGTAICDRKMRYLEVDTVAQRASECSCPEAETDDDIPCQDKIDNMYEKCDGQTRDGIPWDQTKTRVKEQAEQSACSRASRTSVALAAILMLLAIASADFCL
eukprot:SAG31_NODE_1189_length_9480_cov_19.686174_5_plen_153_part_00